MVLSFIVTDNTGRTNEVLPYLYTYPEHFSNVVIRPVNRPLVIFKFFGSINEVYSHNKSGQYDLKLEKFWVTWCGWLY